MKTGFYFLLLVFACNVYSLNASECEIPSETTASGTFYEPKEKLCPGDLIFEENFDTFDLKKWQHEITLSGSGNGRISEFQYYSNNRSNSYVFNGSLHIEPTYLSDDLGGDYIEIGGFQCYGGTPADQCTNPSSNGCRRQATATGNILNPIKSASIRTVESMSFKYGSVVVRAKLPAGDWLFPTILLLPRDNSYGGWPASGEIDLMQSRGNKDLTNEQGVNVGTKQISQTLHWGPFYEANQWAKTHWEMNSYNVGYDTHFHIYKLEWTSTGISFYIDDKQIGSIEAPDEGFWIIGDFGDDIRNPWKYATKMAPFDQEFYVVINLAVGGTNGYFSDNYVNPYKKPWSNEHPSTAISDFWNGRNYWEPTWNLETEDSHLIVDYVQIFAI